MNNIFMIIVIAIVMSGIITPYNTDGNNDPIYCGFGESKDNNCISDIPQGVKIHKSDIVHIS